MAVKITVKLESVKELRAALSSQRVKKEAARDLITVIKEFISNGISPVFGERRFVAYKDPKKYPAGKKPNRPVNMYLSGDMMAALTSRDRAREGFAIGWFSGKEAKKAQAHNTGDGVPERRLLPTREGERFNASITRTLRNFYAKTISDILKRAK